MIAWGASLGQTLSRSDTPAGWRSPAARGGPVQLRLRGAGSAAYLLVTTADMLLLRRNARTPIPWCAQLGLERELVVRMLESVPPGRAACWTTPDGAAERSASRLLSSVRCLLQPRPSLAPLLAYPFLPSCTPSPEAGLPETPLKTLSLPLRPSAATTLPRPGPPASPSPSSRLTAPVRIPTSLPPDVASVFLCAGPATP